MSEMLGANGKFYADEFISIAFSRETLRALRPAAKQRDVSVAVLVRDIVAAVAADRLADAVLDDGDERGKCF